MSRFTVFDTPLLELKVIERKPLSDKRGFLTRLFCNKEFDSMCWSEPIAQINHTSTVNKGTIRGMHFQCPPYSEKKLVNCLDGEVWDVAVDVRSGSPTFLQWYGVHLSAKNCLALLIPEGFAHGFQTLTKNVELLYCHSAPYKAEAERGVNPRDPKLAIDWPIPVTEISDRDKSHSFLNDDFQGVIL